MNTKIIAKLNLFAKQSLLNSGKLFVFFSILFFFYSPIAQAQQYDILIKGGHAIDAKNNLDKVVDFGIKDGKIARVAPNIPSSEGKVVVDAKGLYVSPGFVDIHSHNYHGVNPHTEYSNGFNALNPDPFTFRTGVTTVVETGGSGWKNFVHFKEQVIDRVQTRVLAMLNIVGEGMKGHPYEQDLTDMDPKMTALTARQYRNHIVGVKLAHYNGHDWEPINRLVEAGTLADIPVMVDFGSATPTLSLETLFMEKLRPGDIYTHVFGGMPGSSREAIVDENYQVRPFVAAAQKRGIIYDVGHGGASFSYKIAVPAIKAGILPNTISTDSHGRSVQSGMKDMTNVMSKFLNMGMSLKDVIAASTWAPANVIKRPELGHLSEGAEADLTVFNVREGKFGFTERTGFAKMPGTKKIEVEMTLRNGKVVWDLNGLSAPMWD